MLTMVFSSFFVKKKTNMSNVNWNQYQLYFPKRYFERTYFDEKLEFFLHTSFPIKTALDIGGGRNGTAALKVYNIKTWLLDPFVHGFAEWMQGKTTWNSIRKFDLIVARGSINYLTEDQIRKIFSLKFKKFFIANSFDEHPDSIWTERPFLTLSGESGIEKFKYNEQSRTVEHKLEFKNGFEIEHNFYYYSEEQFRKMIPNVEIEKYGKNSILLTKMEK